MSATHFVKTRKIGERKFRFIGEGGRETRLRVHALRFTSEQAQLAVAELATCNPDYEYRAQRIN